MPVPFVLELPGELAKFKRCEGPVHFLRGLSNRVQYDLQFWNPHYRFAIIQCIKTLVKKEFIARVCNLELINWKLFDRKFALFCLKNWDRSRAIGGANTNNVHWYLGNHLLTFFGNVRSDPVAHGSVWYLCKDTERDFVGFPWFWRLRPTQLRFRGLTRSKGSFPPKWNVKNTNTGGSFFPNFWDGKQ